MDKIKEFSEQDLADRRRRIAESAKHRRDFDLHIEHEARRGQHIPAKTTIQKGEPVEIEEPITVKSLASALGIKGNDIVRKLFLQGVRDVNINSSLETEAAGALALEYGIELRTVQQATLEQQLEQEMTAAEPDESKLVIRPPVVTILGHVDHGKTSLLDKIRHANVAAGEFGGITQHTRRVDGHRWRRRKRQAASRSSTRRGRPGVRHRTAGPRGWNMTDVVVLVVSAVEGVQPQTIESINHARAADVPIVVALNKIDRSDANPEMGAGTARRQWAESR